MRLLFKQNKWSGQMLKLRNKSFKIITENLKEKARPIDRERFNNHFNNAELEKLIEEIEK